MSFVVCFVQTFLLDHEVIRSKLRQLRERCFPASKFKYVNVEDDIVSTPGWPPVGDDPISAIYRDDTNYLQASESDRMLPTTSDSNNCYSTASGLSLASESIKTSTTPSDSYLHSQNSVYHTDTSNRQLDLTEELSDTEELLPEHSGNGTSADVLIEPKEEHSGNGTETMT